MSFCSCVSHQSVNVLWSRFALVVAGIFYRQNRRMCDCCDNEIHGNIKNQQLVFIQLNCFDVVFMINNSRRQSMGYCSALHNSKYVCGLYLMTRYKMRTNCVFPDYGRHTMLRFSCNFTYDPLERTNLFVCLFVLNNLLCVYSDFFSVASFCFN